MPTPLTNYAFREHFHACAFVAGADEEISLVDPFIAETARQGNKTVYIVDPERHGACEHRLRPFAPTDDQLEVTTWREAHLKGGSFDQDRMIKALDAWIVARAASARSPLRLVGQMDWMFQSPPGIEQLVAYESAVNDVLSRGKTPTVCVYDVRRIGGSMLMDLMRAHPLTIVNGVVHENPFYTPAEEMLRELAQRRRTN
jgi:hypothetical protein